MTIIIIQKESRDMKDDELKKMFGNRNLNIIKSIIKTDIENIINILYLSIEYDIPEIIEYIFKKVSPDFCYNCDYTPLEYACLCGKIDSVKIIINHKAAYIGKDNSLLYAASYGESEIYQILLKNSYDVNMSDNDGWNSCHWAAQENNVNIAKIALNYGCDINALNKKGFTPLYIASAENNIEMVCFLLDNNAVPDLSEDVTPLIIACSYGNYQSAELLIRYGADVNGTDSDNRTPLFYATLYGYPEIKEMLLSNGASGKIKDKYGIAPDDLNDTSILERLRIELYGK